MLRALLISLAAPLALSAQASITGALQAQRGDALRPVADCVVFAQSIDNGPLVGEYSDSKGRFTLACPPDPRVTVGADCPGYRLVSVDGRRSSVLTYDCSQPGVCAEVALTLEPLAVVEGVVLDSNGMPMEGMGVGLRPTGPNTRGRGGRGYRAASDDRGYFRLFHLLPGPYSLDPIIGAQHGRGPSLQADSLPIELQPGDVLAGVQVQLRLVETVPFTGRIQGLPPGTKQVYIQFSSQQGNVRGGSGMNVEVDEQGRFQLEGLTPGQYEFEMGVPDEEGHFSSSQRSYLGVVDVGSGGEAVFSRREPIRVSGTLDIEWPERDDLPGPIEGRPLFLNFLGEGGYRAGAQAQPPDYRFEVPRLRPGRYRLQVSGPGPKVERRTGEDAWEPFTELAVNEGDTVELDLRVRFELGRLTVAVRPADKHYVVGIRANGYTQLFPTDQNGRLVMNYFAGGDYQICAWPDIDPEEANDPETWRKAGDAVREFQHSEGVDMEITLTAAP